MPKKGKPKAEDRKPKTEKPKQQQQQIECRRAARVKEMENGGEGVRRGGEVEHRVCGKRYR